MNKFSPKLRCNFRTPIGTLNEWKFVSNELQQAGNELISMLSGFYIHASGPILYVSYPISPHSDGKNSAFDEPCLISAQMNKQALHLLAARETTPKSAFTPTVFAAERKCPRRFFILVLLIAALVPYAQHPSSFHKLTVAEGPERWKYSCDRPG
ncbi:MAG: hypothetical protein NVV59_08780 [Chitinophagaceae bacterium]|nr:hypothetical protein [Chitinophagaceae bacterium]